MNKTVFTGLVVILIAAGMVGCNQAGDLDSNESKNGTSVNPAAADFNAEASDSIAIAVADSVMEAMGGYKSWDQTKIISWNFFGRRTHTWNKHSGRDSINIPGKKLTIDMNIQSKEGEVFKNGTKLTQADSVQKYLEQGYAMWVNDSYWLLMPYKLKDSGVTLSYMGMDSTEVGIPAHKLKMTFDSVGITPKNMYHVWVDTTDYLVRQWAHYPEDKSDMPAGFVLPWDGYEKYGQILLSGNRGKFTLSDIAVMQEWPK